MSEFVTRIRGSRCPVLRKIEGDTNICPVTPITLDNNGTYVIGGKSDNRLKLKSVSSRSSPTLCRIWEVVNDSLTLFIYYILSCGIKFTKINDNYIRAHLPKVLKCGDIIAFETPVASFQFECFASDCAKCNKKLRLILQGPESEIKEYECIFVKPIQENSREVIETSKLTSLIESEFKCIICDEIFVDPMVINCGHTFCEECLVTWKNVKANCPVCRCPFSMVTKSLAVDSYLKSIMPFLPVEKRNNWTKVIEERKKKKIPSRKRQHNGNPVETEAPSSRRRITVNISYSISRVYERLTEVQNNLERVIDLTTDPTD